jgi:phage terminase Nu1 subunit (DNA packaging protein)
MTYANIGQLCRTLDVTPQTVGRLVAGGMPKAGRGQYPLLACMRWYIVYLQDILNGRGQDDGPATSLTRARLEQMRLKTAELHAANLKRESQLIDLAAWRPDQREIRRILRAGLRSLGRRLRKKLAPDAHVQLTAELRAIDVQLVEAFAKLPHADAIQALIAKDRRKRVAGLNRGER